MVKSKAMVVPEPGRMEMRKFSVASPAPDQVLVKTAVTSVCSSDVKFFHGAVSLARFPLIMGHEISGVVVEAGAEAAGWYDVSPGDRVTVEPYIPCGRCEASRSDHFYHQCTHGGIYGLNLTCDTPPYLFGGYSEYFYLLPGSVVYKVEAGVDPMSVSLSSVVGNGVRWVKTLGKVTFGRSVVISGAGSQGLCTLAAAKTAGARPVIVLGLEKDAVRFELAREFGADAIIKVDREDARSAVFRYLPEGADVVIETSGRPEAIRTAIDLVRKAGRVVSIGLSGGLETPVPFDELAWKGITLVSGVGQAGNVKDAMKIIEEGRFPFERINNKTYRLEDLEQALADTETPPEGFIKGAVIFD